MKISELPRLTTARRDAEFPIAVEGENYNITLEQIYEEVSSGTSIEYEAMLNMTSGVALMLSRKSNTCGMSVMKSIGNGISVNVGVLDMISDNMSHLMSQVFTTHYTEPQADGTFAAHDDYKVYTYVRSIGTTSTTIPKTWSAWKLKTDSSPIEVASEEEMAQRIALGEYDEGQLYFLAEK